MKDSETSNPQLKIALEQALKILQDPHCDCSKPEYKSVTSLFHKIDFFHRVFNSPLELEEFTELAKYYLDYEVHPYGTILMKEKEHAEKFYLILKGSAHKLHQRPYADVEFDFKNSKVKTKTNSQHGSDNEPNSATNKANPFTERIQRMETCKTEKTTITFKRSQKFNSDFNSDVIKNVPENNDFNDNSPRSILRKGGLKLAPSSPTSKTNQFSHKDSSSASSQTGKLYFPQNFASIFGGGSSPKEKFDSDNDSKKSNDNNGQKIISKDNKEIIMEFVRDLVSKNPNISHRCFLGDTVRVEINHTYHLGEYFGENFNKQKPPKETSLIAVGSEDIHMLTLTKENFDIILDELSKREKERTQLFSSLFPDLDEKIVHGFSQYFNRRHFRTGEIIYHQNDKAQCLYLLKTGHVNFIKDIEVVPQTSIQSVGCTWVNWSNTSSGRKVEHPLASIVGGQFFGEELLLKEQFMRYTAISNTPETMVYILELGLYKKIQYEFKTFFDILRTNAEEKFAWRDQKVSEYVEHLKIFSEGQEHELTLPELRKNKSVPSPRYSLLVHKEAIDEVKTIMTPSSEPKYLKTDTAAIHKSKFSQSYIPPVALNLELYKDKFSRKVKAFVHGNGETNAVLELNIRKELEGIKVTKLRLPNLHFSKKSADFSVKKWSGVHAQCDNLTTNSTRNKHQEEQAKFAINDICPIHIESLSDKIESEKAELKKILRHVNYVPAHPNFFNSNIENILKLENTLS